MTLPKIYLALRSTFPQKFGSERVNYNDLDNYNECSGSVVEPTVLELKLKGGWFQTHQKHYVIVSLSKTRYPLLIGKVKPV